MNGPHRGRARSAWLVLAFAALVAFIRWFVMSSPTHFSSWLPAAWFVGEHRALTRAALNAATSAIVLVGLPASLLSLPVLRLSLGLLHGARLWGLGRPQFNTANLRRLALCLPLGACLLGVLAALLSPGVREVYPVFRAAGESGINLVLSVGMTLCLILATELFYRGGALFLLERYFGPRAIYLLLPIYVLDHVGAPLVELAGSAVAGALLGHLALSCRSIWPGFAAHACCALAVDLSAALLWGGA